MTVGTPLPPNQIGTPCPECWGPGRTFGDFDTPRFLTLTFLDLDPGEFWIPADEDLIRMPHLIEQTLFVCQWNLFFSAYQVALVWGPNLTILNFVNVNTGKFLFFHQAPDPCAINYTNDIILAANRQAHSGSVLIEWNPEEVQ